MQQSKYQELKNEIQDLRMKMLGQHRLMQSTMIFMKDVNHQLDSLKELSLRAEVYAEADFEALMDKRRGLRQKAESEAIEHGDIVFVDFTSQIEGTDLKNDQKDFPIRVGTNTVTFEQELIGRFPNQKGISVAKEFQQGQYAGKTAKFEIAIRKVKTKILKGVDDELDEPARDTAVEGGVEPQDNNRGQGHEELSGSEAGSIQN